MLLLEVNDPGGEPQLIVGNMILTKQIRLDLPTTTFFVQINDYGKWEASLQISIKPQEIFLTLLRETVNLMKE